MAAANFLSLFKKSGKAKKEPVTRSEHGALSRSEHGTRRTPQLSQAPSWFERVSGINDSDLDASRKEALGKQKARAVAEAVMEMTDQILALENPKISREFEEINRTFTGSRLRCLFHRTWFMENKKKDRDGYQVKHPVFDAIQLQRERGDSSSFSRHSSVESMELMGLDLDPAGKTWERLFGSFLTACEAAGGAVAAPGASPTLSSTSAASAAGEAAGAKLDALFQGMIGDGAVDIEAQQSFSGSRSSDSAMGLNDLNQLVLKIPLASPERESPLSARAAHDGRKKDKTKALKTSSSSIFEQVAEQFEEHESPFLSVPSVPSRRSSPSLTIALAIKEKERAMELSHATYSASAAIPITSKASPHGAAAAVSFEHVKEIQLRTVYTEIHNNTQYASDTASAFLGENLSVTRKGMLQRMVERSASDEALDVEREVDSAGVPSEDAARRGTWSGKEASPSSMPRSASIDSLLKAGMISASPPVAPSPCLLKMPPLKSRRDVGEALGNIPNYSWILPYVVACAPPYMMNYLAALPCVFGYNRSGRESRSARQAALPPPPPQRPASPPSTPFATQGMAKKVFFPPADEAASEQGKLPSSAPPSSSSRAGASPRSPRPVPYPSQANVGAPHWYSLGIVWVCRHPAWQLWEERAIFVCHNYLFECLPDLQHGIIGYAQLSGSVLSRGSSAVLNAEPFSPGNSSHGGSSHDSSPPRTDSRVAAIQISVLTASKVDAPRAALWIRGTHPEDLDLLEEILRGAQELTLEDVYRFPDGPEEEVILGRGRYNVVRKAERRNVAKPLYSVLRPAFERPDSPEFSPSSPPPPPPPLGHLRVMRTSDSAASLGFSMHSVDSLDAPEDVFFDDSGGPFRSVLSDSSHSDAGARPHAKLPDIGEDSDGEADGESEDDEGEEGGEGEGEGEGGASLCALKLVSKEIFWKRVNLGKERGDSLVREILSQALVCDSLQNLRSTRRPDDLEERPYEYPHRIPVVDIFNVFETPDGFALDLELMEHVDLFDKLSRDGRFSEVAAQQVVLQLIDAVDLCNRLGIAHRDIKLSNITFPRKTAADAEEAQDLGLTEEQSLCVKLADFGMAGFEGRDKRLKGRCGTPGYVAPDILRAGMNESYDIHVDVFSIGVVAYTLLCGYEPFYGADDAELIRANKNITYEFHLPEWADVSDLAKDWISSALKDGRERMTAPRARLHPWLADAVKIEQRRLERARRLEAARQPQQDQGQGQGQDGGPEGHAADETDSKAEPRLGLHTLPPKGGGKCTIC